jgi:chromate transporter
LRQIDGSLPGPALVCNHVSIGLIAASGHVVASVAVQNVVAIAAMAITAAISYATRLNPLWIFAAAALLSLVGWL